MVNIKFLGHSAIQICYNNSVILIDPFLSQNPSFCGNIDEISANDILLTHGHVDHLGDAIPISKRTGAMISAVFELANYCQARNAKANPLSLGAKVKFDWGYATFLSAAHSSSTPDGAYAGCAASILLEIGGLKIYHAGDSALHYDLKIVGEFYKPDIALLPVGGHFTMGIDEALEAVKWISPRVVIPIHYDTFDLISADVNAFKKNVEEKTDAECKILSPSESIEF